VKSTRTWAILSGIAVTFSLVAVGAAEAAPQAAPGTGSVSSVARTSDGQAVTDSTTGSAVTGYWTPERMASAIPADAPASASSRTATADRKPDGPAGSVDAAGPSTFSATGSQAAEGVGILLNESQTVGKVFFSNPANGLNYVCSGAALNSGKKRLVQTAGHCVHGGAGGQWMNNWAFVPRYRNGARPFGTWYAYQLTSRTAWINSSNSDEDMGIAIMGDLNGQRIVNVVGGNGLRWNWGYSVSVTILGYPAGAPFTGELQYFCQGTTWNGHGQQVRAWCNMTGGSSGGPWLQEYNDQNGLGYINSVVSHRHDDANQMDGPYFDNDIKSLYDFAESLSP
jgi:V8-like Glu-specific endopeptidase